MERCSTCGAPDARISHGGGPLCERCVDAEVSEATGWPRLLVPPGPVSITDPDGNTRVLRYRFWRAPTGIVVEAAENDTGGEEGYRFEVLGAHDADIDALVEEVTAQATAEIGRRYLEPHPWRDGWLAAGDEIAGRLVHNGHDEPSSPYDVVIDGRTLTWDQLGAALEPYEGFRFRLAISDRLDDARPDATIIDLPTPLPATEEDHQLPEAQAPDQQVPDIQPPDYQVSIDAALDAFLAAERERLAARTFRNYEAVIGLLRDCLNGYAYQSLDPGERARWDAAYNDNEDALTAVFGPEKIPENLGEFLGHFMIRKVMCGEELLAAAGTVTKKLVAWLADHGYIDPDSAAQAAEAAGDAARDLPRAEKLAGLLHDQSRATAINPRALADEDYVEDYLMIEAVEPGKLFFEGGVGPVKVTKEASGLAQVGWSVNITLGRAGKAWQVLGVGNVYP